MQFSLADSAAFEEWVLLKREWLHQRLLDALPRLVAFHEGRGDYPQALRFARQQLELDAWREESHRQLMRLLGLNGERSAALEQYKRCRQVLAEELGVEPESATTALYEQLRDRAPAAPVAASRRSAAASRLHTLPPPVTPFIGREQEVEKLTRLLDNPACRLVTLTGVGGVGKTRLALQAAALQVESFADGVYWVPLASVSAPERLARAILEAVGLPVASSKPPEVQLLAQLQNQELLLVLDNFEQLLAGAPLLARLLVAAPGVSLLVTSRARLHLQGEWLLELAGLQLPPPDAAPADWERSSAVQLFVRSAQRVLASFKADVAERPWIEQICRLLDGLPLGIELAAAWSRLLSCAEIAQAIARDLAFLTSSFLQDLPARHRSLQAVFDHSWLLLSTDEKRLLRTLALFRGGFRHEAAEQVAGGSLPLLAALLDKSLLHRSPSGRYGLHEMVRQYAWWKLELSGELAAVQARHLHFFVELAETAETHYRGPEQGRWLAVVAAEHANVQGALEWSLASGEAETGLRLAVALYRYWQWRCHVEEGGRWLEALLAATTEADAATLPLRARALHVVGVLTDELGNYARAVEYYQQSLALRQRQGDKAGQAVVLNSLGIVAWEQQEYARAQGYLEASLRLRREAGQREGLTPALNNLGLLALARQDFAGAQVAFEEVLVIDRDLQDQMGIAAVLLNLGTVMLDRGEPGRALPYFQESLALHWELAEREGVAYCLEGLAGILSAQPAPAAARESARLFGAAARLREVIQMPLSPTESGRYARHSQAAQELLDEAAFAAAWASGSAMPLEQAVAHARGCPWEGEALQRMDCRLDSSGQQ